MKKHLLLILFIIIYLLYAVLSYKSFGITWDEQAVYERGKMLYKHLIDPNSKSNQDLLIRQSTNNVWPTYNNTYATILYAFNQNQSYEVYHLQNMLFAIFLFIAAYFFLYHQYQDSKLAIVGPLFVVLSPRFFGHIPANPKDVPFAIFYFLAITLISLTYPIKNQLLRVLFLGIIFGLAQTSRILGFSLYPILLIFDYINRDKKIKLRTFLVNEFILIAMTFLFSLLIVLFTWPYVAGNFFKNFIDVIHTTKQFPWSNYIFFMGQYIHSQNLTLLYIPVWFLVSLPVFMIISWGGLVLFRKKIFVNQPLFLSLSVVIINFVLYIFLQPIVYDGVRHFLFLYPFFSIISAVIIIELIRSKYKKIKRFFLVLVIINSILIVISQVKLFPYQYIYFNELIGGTKGGSKYFEVDYWNTSFYEAVTWLKDNELRPDRKYSIYTCSSSLSLLYYFTHNMSITYHVDEADYAVCLTRGEEYKSIKGKVLHIVSRNSVPLNYVIKIKK